MIISFLISSIISFSILFYFVYINIKDYREGKSHHGAFIFSLILIFFFIFGIVSLAWTFNLLDYSNYDLLMIFCIFLIYLTLILFRVYSNFIMDNSFKYMIFLYMLSVILSFLIFEKSLIVNSIISLLFILILNVQAVFILDGNKRSAYAGIIFSSLSLLFISIYFFNYGGLLFYLIIAKVLFFIYSYLFLKDIYEYPLKKSTHHSYTHKKSYLLIFLKYFVFIILISNLVLISTIGIHELGHVSAAYAFKCNYKTVLFEEGTYPYTEVLCGIGTNKIPVSLAGPLFPIIISLLLFFAGGTFIKDISLIIIGFDLIASYKDAIELGLSESMGFFIMILGLIFLFLGIVLLARSRIKDNLIL